MTASPGTPDGATPSPPRPKSKRVRKPTEPVESSHPSRRELDRDDIVGAIRRVFAGVTREGLDRDEAIRQVAHELGFERAGSRVAQDIDNALRAASQRGVVYSEGGVLYCDCKGIRQYPRDVLKQTLASVIGHTWWNEDDAIVASARHLGFQRTGSVIKTAFKSAIRGALRLRLLERDGDCLRRKKQ